jgi:hypothetical protein
MEADGSRGFWLGALDSLDRGGEAGREGWSAEVSDGFSQLVMNKSTARHRVDDRLCFISGVLWLGLGFIKWELEGRLGVAQRLKVLVLLSFTVFQTLPRFRNR